MSSPVDRYVPEPTVFLTGCQPWPPAPRADGSCPVCGGGILPEHRTYQCGWCDAVAPAVEARIRAGRLGLKVRSEIDRAKARLAELTQRRKGRAVLSERDRRRLWNGYRGSLLESNPEPTNRAEAGREFLISIGQTPNFDLILDNHGRVVGGRQESA